MIRHTFGVPRSFSDKNDIVSTLLSIEEPQLPEQRRREFALFRLGFRPFFLFGPIFSIFALGYFILWMSGTIHAWPSAWDALAWHRHEMLFGYAGAIIAGFLLTAVPNWTGHPTPKGRALAATFGLWLAGRAALLFSSHFSSSLVMMVDCSFFIACASGVAPALIRSKNKRNYFFIVLLLGLCVSNILTHVYRNEGAELSVLGIRIALAIIIMIMVIIGGRVIPFFTERPLGLSIPRKPALEKAALLTSAVALVLDATGVSDIMAGMACLAAALVNGWRLSGWHGLKTLKVPLLWVLHLGYGWIVVGFAIRGLELLGMDIPAIVATHAFTVGGIGALTLGMMARVSLGHSGRPLEIGKAMVVAFAAINLAAFCRVFGIWFFPSLIMRFLEFSSALWLIAFGIYVVIYAPILLRPRLDGKDG